MNESDQKRTKEAEKPSPKLSEERAQFLFGKVRPGEDREAFKARVKKEFQEREILTEEGKLNPELRDR